MLTVLDCKKGYWHQQLDEESSYLTTSVVSFITAKTATIKVNVTHQHETALSWFLAEHVKGKLRL